MSFEVQVARSVTELGPEAWDRLGGDVPFASYQWYWFGETVLEAEVPVYVVLWLAGEPVARATFWLKRQETLPVRSKSVRLLLGVILRYRPLLVCRTPLAETSGLVLPEPPLREAALETIVRCAMGLSYQNASSFLLFDYLDHQLLEQPVWSDRFGKVRDMHPGTQLAITWPDFETYLAHLGKKRRYNVRRNYRLAAEQGIEVKRHRSVLDVELAMALHRNVNARHRAPTSPWMRRALECADMVDAVWLAAQVGERLVGSELMLGDRGTWLVIGLGLDYSLQNVYFVLGYEDIRCAFEHGARALRWGAETYSVKQRLGFEPEGNSNLVFAARWPALQRFGRWVAENHLD